MTDTQYHGTTDFVHLHCHTKFSLLDGVASPEEYFAACKERGWSAIAITEHGNLASVPPNYFAAKKYNIKYIAGCFLPNQPVCCESGIKNISDIESGERVLTHQNHFKKVLNVQTRPYGGDVIIIKAWGVEPIICTPEHPILTRVVERTEIRRGVWQENIYRDYLKASELSRTKYHRTYATKRSKDRSNKRRYKHYLCVPKLKDGLLNPINIANLAFKPDAKLAIENGVIKSVTYSRAGYKTTANVNLPEYLIPDEEFLWVCGIWLAEGSLKPDRSVEFTFGGSEMKYAERVSAYFAKFNIFTGIRHRENKNTIDVSVSSAYFSRVFKQLFGHGFANKKLNNKWLFNLNKNQAEALINGIFDGDAKIGNRQSYLKLCNRTLIWQMRLLLTKFDQYSAIGQVPNNNSDNMGYVIRRRESGHCYYDWDDDYIYLPVAKISREQYSGLVYNLEVEEDNTYNVGVVVHNCEIYYNDYELERQKFIAEGKKMGELKQTNPELWEKMRRNRHITVYAKNKIGFENLVKLSTQAYETGMFYRPRVWFDKLLEYKEGLVIASGCINGPASHAILNKNKNESIEYLSKFKKEFGDDFYVEVQMPCLPDMGDFIAFTFLVKFAKDLGIDTILTNDSHYLDRKDYEIQKLMMAIDQGLEINSDKLFHMSSDEQYLKTRAELYHTFKTNRYSQYVTDNDFEVMCNNTIKLANSCENFEPDMSSKVPSVEDAENELREKVYSELRKRGLYDRKEKYFVDNREVTYAEQADIELNRFIEKGFASYFLITADIVKFSNEHGWPVGPRGSAGGSLVNYLLGISEIDPLIWKLSFNRFLSPARGGDILNIKAE